jgi:hypothetical protein
MKKLLFVLLTQLICVAFIYPQKLHEVGTIKEPVKKTLHLPLSKQYKVFSSSFVESFENTTFPPDGWDSYFYDGGTGWSRQTVGTPLPGWSPGTISTPPGGGNAVAYCTRNNNTIYNDQTLVTPYIQNIQLSDTLFFWVRNQTNRADTIEVYFSNDSNFVFLGYIYYPDVYGIYNTDWMKWYVPLGKDLNNFSLIGSGGYIEFNEYIEDNLTNGGPISLDLVELKSSGNNNSPGVATNSATNVTSNSAKLNGTVNPNNLSTDVLFEYGTTTAYGDMISADESPVSGTTDVNVGATLTGLSPNTTYHYRINATNSAGNTTGADVTFTTSSSASAPSVTTTNATNITSTSATLNGIVNANNFSTTALFEYGTTTSYGNSIDASQNPVTGSTNQNVSANLTGLQSNTTYHYRLNGTNNAGNSSGADVTFTTNHAAIYPTTIDLSATFTFGSDISKSSSYRMIGLPGNQTNFKMTDLITTGTPKTDWNAYYDNGDTSSNGLVEFDGSSLFNFTPGKGFWVLNKTQLSISKTVNTVTLLADNSYSIPLHLGWNIISNPFEINVNWTDIQNMNGLNTNDIIYSWNGSSYTQPATFENYKGFYFYNSLSTRSSLKIPYEFSIVITKSNNFNQDQLEGSIKLSLLQNKQIKSFVAVGFNSLAKKDYDKFDYLSPPGNFEEFKISILEQSLSIPYKQLSVDYRPGISDGQSYDILVKNESKEKIQLAASGLHNFPGVEIYLLDENLKRFYNLKEKNEIDISPIHKKNNLKLLIGDESFINDIKSNFIPSLYILAQNYPNPFNPSTVIKYQIPKSELVKLNIYNVLGKEVKTLVKEIQDAGVHEVEFNGKDLSSGIYFYSLNAGSFSSTKKMILMK